MKQFIKSLVLFALFLLSMAGCGGGGGDATTPPQQPPATNTQTTATAITTTSPGNNAISVPTNSKITATFSTSQDPATITTSTFTVNGVSGAVTYDAASRTATFSPTADLTANTLYTATLTTGIKDLSGATLATSYVWSFTTKDNKDSSGNPASPKDTTPAFVTSTTPTNLATDVATNSSLAITFNENINPASTSGAITLRNAAGTSIAGSIATSSQSVIFTPSQPLSPLTSYTVTISSNLSDLAGNKMAADYSWSFTTKADTPATPATPAVPSTDTTPPTVNSTNPAENESGVPENHHILIIFSEKVDPLTVTTTSVNLKQGTTFVSGTLTINGSMVLFSPSADLAPNTTYTMTVSKTVADLAGNTMATDMNRNFTTGATKDTTPPTSTAVSPANGATNVSTSSPISISFSEAMDPSNPALSGMVDGKPATLTYDPVSKTFTLVPQSPLQSNATYVFNVRIPDLSGNLSILKSWSFTTGS